MRSKLFVPGARAELFDKALASAADAVSFDLEDSVPPAHKAEARARVGEVVRGMPARGARALVIVRVNALDSSSFADDLRAVVRPGLDLITRPKAGSPADVLAAVAALEAAEAANGVSRPLPLLVNIETPAALLQAAAIAGAHPRVAGLQLGLGDLFEPLGIARDDPANVHAAMFALRMAAGTAGVWACDAAFADLRDLAGFRAEAQVAQRLGFIGKSCIHPSQIAIANEVFRVSDDELAAAQRVLDAARGPPPGRRAGGGAGRRCDGPRRVRRRWPDDRPAVPETCRGHRRRGARRRAFAPLLDPVQLMRRP